MSSSLSYGRTAILLTSVNSQVFGSTVTLAGSSTIIASSGWIDLSINQLTKVGTCSRCGATTFVVVVEHDLHFWWAHLAASFQMVPLWMYSTCHSANSSTTCFASSEVSLAFSLSQHASLDCSMPCSSSGQFLGAQRCIHPPMLPSLLSSALVRVLNQFDTMNRCKNCCLKTAVSSLGKIFSSKCENLCQVDLVCHWAIALQLVGIQICLESKLA